VDASDCASVRLLCRAYNSRWGYRRCICGHAEYDDRGSYFLSRCAIFGFLEGRLRNQETVDARFQSMGGAPKAAIWASIFFCSKGSSKPARRPFLVLIWWFCCLMMLARGSGMIPFISNWRCFLSCCNFLTSNTHLVGPRTSSLTGDRRCVPWSIMSLVTAEAGIFDAAFRRRFLASELNAAGGIPVCLIMRLHSASSKDDWYMA
jgi:hypothetical protein